VGTIVYNQGERAIIEGFWCGQATFGSSPTLVPSPGGNWGLGLGTRVGGVGVDKTNLLAQILELGTATAAGYGRAVLTRDHNGWPAPTRPGTSYLTTSPQQTFTFTGGPSPNGATLWFVAGSAVTSDDNALFGADLAQTRTFNIGDVERITAAYQQG
jgi:hypothetical protein